jgi:uncharacterized protein
VDFTLTTKGLSFDQLTRDVARDLRAAHKKAGRQVARKGRAAVKKGAPHVGHKALGTKAKTEAAADHCKVTFTPVTVGGWTMWEDGADAHRIRPRSRRALKFAAVYAETVDHPGFGARKSWTAAGARIAKAARSILERQLPDGGFNTFNGGPADVSATVKAYCALKLAGFAEDADLIGKLREEMWSNGVMTSTVRKGKKTEGEKFKDYFDYNGALHKLPSHRILALFRGEKEEILELQMMPEANVPPAGVRSTYELKIMQRFAITDQGRPGDRWLIETARWAWRTKIQVHLNIDLRMRLWTAAETEGVRVFASNLRDLLLAAPAGARVTMGLDPGFRSGVKVAIVDATGKVVATTAIYPHEPQKRWDEALATLGKLAVAHGVDLIAIGNGTASRETDKLAMELVKLLPDLKMSKIVVSEAGASVYSASAFASEELPELDVTLRGAVSIARRLQDPLAELVKIDPKSIGVGQYQHDVHPPMLGAKLEEVVEDCVNRVGVELNTASAPLLARVAGIGPALATKIVQHREQNGAFKGRAELQAVGGLGPKTFEQCAGFLRIRDGAHPLDASAVHPERYDLVERMAKDLGKPLGELVGNEALAGAIDVAKYASPDVGEPTLRDILDELRRPGRDPRQQFEPPKFRDDVTKPEDLKPGMALEGVVTNVTAFGAFVDVGVHQDGLVHVSQLADRFVKDPREVVKAGDIVKVRVKDVDVARKRIALTMKSGAIDRGAGPRQSSTPPPQRGSAPPPRQSPQAPAESAFAAALRRAQESK